MKRLNVYIRAFQGAFEQTPKVFQTVCVNVSLRVALSMVDHATVVIALKIVVRHKRIRANRRAFFNVFPNVTAQLWPSRIWNDLQYNARMLFHSSAFQNTLHSRFPETSVS